METESIQMMRMQCLNLAFQMAKVNTELGVKTTITDIISIANKLLNFVETGK